MPELPEVETVRNGLADILKNRPRIINITTSNKKLRGNLSRSDKKKLSESYIKRIERRAKFLLIQLDTGVLLSHLGMTGSWRLLEKNEVKGPHDHCLIYLYDNRTLVYRDPRRFGVLEFYPGEGIQESKWLIHLGPEPLSSIFTGKYLKNKAGRRKAPIKNFIMDQKIVVGVGNIYAQEALFVSKISPFVECGQLSEEKYRLLVKSIKKILRRALKAGGSTISDFRQAGGSKGYFQHQFLVYGRAEEPCVNCSEPLMLDVIGGRSTVWCLHCQKGEK